MATKLKAPDKPTKASLFYYDVVNLVADLYGRWLDEQGNEDIDEYKALLQKYAKRHGLKITKANKRPFRFTFIDGDKEYVLGANAQEVWYKRLK